MTREESQTISLLRFPLALAIVAIHTKSLFPAPETQTIALDSWQSWYELAYRLVTSNLVAVAIPLFTLISAYLLFQGLQQWDWHVYKSKLKRRVHTLMIPYFLWNLIVVGLNVSTFAFRHFRYGSSWNDLFDWYQTKGGIIHMMWDYNYNFIGRTDWLGFLNETSWPICAPLWFVRDLMILILLAPFFHWVLRKYPLSSMLLLFLCSVSGVWIHLPGFTSSTSFWFGLGACLAIHDVGILVKRKRTLWLLLILWLGWNALSLWQVVSMEKHIEAIILMFSVISGVFSVMGIVNRLSSRWGWKLPTVFSSACFFVYAAHSICFSIFGAPLTLSARLMAKLLGEGYPALLLRLLIVPLLTAVSCVLLHYILTKLFPRLMSVLDGNR